MSDLLLDIKAKLKPVMTTAEVADALQITEKEVRRLADRRILKPLRGYKGPMKFSGVHIAKWLEGEWVQ